MAKTQYAISEFRNVIINNNVAQIAAPIDAHFAMLHLVKKKESEYFKNPAIADLAGVTVVSTGCRNDQIHFFTVTTTLATGTYSIQYVETKPNVDA